jgi:hypothetical protein
MVPPGKLRQDDCEAIYMADLDKDSYLDVIGASLTDFRVYWGQGAPVGKPGPGQCGERGCGWDHNNRSTKIVSAGAWGLCHNIEVADIDKDGDLDLVMPTWTYPYNISVFYCKSPHTYDPDAILQHSDAGHLHGISVADLNEDGWLDIVSTGYQSENTQAIIFWGNSVYPHFSQSDTIKLATDVCYGGSAIQDFNGDGALDIVFFRGQYGWIYKALRPIIFYNDPSITRRFINTNTQEIGIPLTASGGTAADFNKDGNIDIFVNNCERYVYSYIFYGPDFTVWDSVGPMNYDHHATFQEPGHPFDRSKQASYISSVFDAGTAISSGTVGWVANTPGNSKVIIELRGGDSSDTSDASWTAWDTVAISGSSLPSAVVGHRYFQFRATLSYDNPAELPWLERFELSSGKVTCFRGSNKGASKVANLSGKVFKFRLSNPRPNPFTKRATVYYSVPGREGIHTVRTTLVIYDLMGRKIRTLVDGKLLPGNYTATWDGKSDYKDTLPSGVYFLRLQSGAHVKTQPLLLLLTF